ncbi:MAG: ATP-grasp domain-containing protein [Granulicella sp.]
MAATTWWPSSARMAMSLLDRGCEVEAICPPGHPLRYVRGIGRCYLYRRFDSVGSLRKALLQSAPDAIIPFDDGVVWQLHEIFRKEPSLRTMLERSLGRSEYFEVTQSRERLLEVAGQLGVRVPQTRRITSQEQLRNWSETVGSPAILKLDGTWGGNGVHFAATANQAGSLLPFLLKPVPRMRAWKRLIVDRDPIALWSWKGWLTPTVTVQEFIPGRPANTMMVCWQGKVLGMVTVEVLWSQGPRGSATVVRLIEHEEIAQAAHLIAGRLELSGFHGLDFILEEGSGKAYLLELNPRCTQLGHLPITDQGDLAGLFYSALTGTAVAIDPTDFSLSPPDTIAFFPQASMWNPRSRALRDGYHDVPWQEPLLVRELLKPLWPNRCWQARLYHWVRPPAREKATAFEEQLSGEPMPSPSKEATQAK